MTPTPLRAVDAPPAIEGVRTDARNDSLESSDLLERLLESDPKLAAAGSIESAGGLPDIIAFIHQTRWSGVLKAMGGGANRQIWFRAGEVCGASSSVRRERLGEILFRYGRVSRSELNSALARARGPQRLGQMLVSEGILTSHDLFVFLKSQVKEIVYAVLNLKKGTYAFERILGDADRVLPDLGLSTQELLFDGARLTDEMDHFRTRIPSSDVVPVKRESGSNLLCLGEVPRQVLALIDGTRTIEEIGRISKLGDLQATRVIFQLTQAGQVEIKRDSPSVLSSRTTNPADFIAFVNSFFGTIERTRLSKSGDLLRRELQTFVEGNTQYASLFEGSVLESHDRQEPLDAKRILSNLERTGKTIQYLQTGLNELLHFVLFVLGDNVAPSGPVIVSQSDERIVVAEDRLEKELLE